MLTLPFSSGHLLGLRVFPQNDFAPYESVWIRPPGEEWSVYSDTPCLETACPRWWGPALRHSELARIEVSWPGPTTLRVEMEEPELTWTMDVVAPPLLRVLNAVSRFLPMWTWKPRPLRSVREWIAGRVLGLGEIRFAFTVPRGQRAILMAERMYFIRESRARLEGRDLGRPVRLSENPTVGDVPLPTRPTFVVCLALGSILDPEEYRDTRARLGAAPAAEA